MFSKWFGVALVPLFLTILKTTGVYLVVILFTRINGLRSFAKISGFDFAMTVAVGSALASTTLSPDPPLLRATVAIGTLFVLQKLVSRLRRNTSAETLVDNQPVLIVDHGEILSEALDDVDLTERDLRAKLRQSGVLRLEDVRAVVVETTGDISIIQTSDERDRAFDDWMLKGVRRAEELASYDSGESSSSSGHK